MSVDPPEDLGPQRGAQRATPERVVIVTEMSDGSRETVRVVADNPGPLGTQIEFGTSTPAVRLRPGDWQRRVEPAGIDLLTLTIRWPGDVQWERTEPPRAEQVLPPAPPRIAVGEPIDPATAPAVCPQRFMTGACRCCAEVERLRAAIPDDVDPAHVRPMLHLLGPARMILDRAAVQLGEHAGQPGHEAADMAQRIVEWIGHPVTDEPARAAELAAEVERRLREANILRKAAGEALEQRDAAEENARTATEDAERLARDHARLAKVLAEQRAEAEQLRGLLREALDAINEIRRELGDVMARERSLRGLLDEALTRWAEQAEMGPHEPGRRRERERIAEIRREAGLP